MPGISVTTGVRVGPTGVDAAPSSTFFAVGTCERGPIDESRLVLSMSQFETIYGEYASTTTLHDSVKTFFEEGGSRCRVARVVGSSPVKAAATVLDGAGSPLIVATVTAANEGVWANSTVGPPAKDGIKVIATVASSTFSVTITYKGSTIFSGGPYVDEVLPDASTKYAKQFFVEAVMADAYARNFVTAAVGASLAIPVAGTKLLTGGVDDVAGVTDALAVTALGLFDYDHGSGAVAIPGRASATIYAGLQTHAVANRRIALCGFTVATTAANAILAADDYYGTDATTRTNGSYMAFYWPSVKVPDGHGGTRDQSPEAYIAAVRTRAIRRNGTWVAPAGEISVARYVSGLYEACNRTTANLLDRARVNALRVIGGVVRSYGARSISSDDQNWRFITYRDTLNYITSLAETGLEPLLFGPIDGRGNLFGQAEAVLVGIMEPIRSAGGVFEGFDPVSGTAVDRGYSVECAASNNPLGTLALGEVSAKIGARVSPVADQINVTITKSTLTAAV